MATLSDAGAHANPELSNNAVVLPAGVGYTTKPDFAPPPDHKWQRE